MNDIIKNILESILKYGVKKIVCQFPDSVLSNKDYLIFDINFIDWEIQNHKNEKGSTLDNCDYWLPILRNELKINLESYWYDSNHAEIWIKKKECLNLIREYKLKRILKINHDKMQTLTPNISHKQPKINSKLNLYFSIK